MKRYSITVNGNTYDVIVEEVEAGNVASAPIVTPAPTVVTPIAAPAASVPAAPKAAPAPKTAGNEGANKVTSPMPGTILDVKVTVGQAVKKGDVICVLEAMKMENDIPAPCDGIVASINTQKGASVAANDLLATLK